MPRMLPIGGRGPYAVGIATEHIRAPVATSSEEELWPLELMAQVSFFPGDIVKAKGSAAPLGFLRNIPPVRSALRVAPLVCGIGTHPVRPYLPQVFVCYRGFL